MVIVEICPAGFCNSVAFVREPVTLKSRDSRVPGTELLQLVFQIYKHNRTLFV